MTRGKPGVLGRIGMAARALVGTFDDDISPEVRGILGGIYPGGRGEPAPRGTDAYLRAYSTMPWLRTVSDRVASAVAATPWRIYVVRNKRTKEIRRHRSLQRADPLRRRAMLRALDDTGDLEELTDHPILDVLHDANSLLTGGSSRALTQLYLDLVGEGFYLKERNSAGMPVGLWPLPPHWVSETPSPQLPRFTVCVPGNGKQWDIPDTEILWLKHPDPLNPYGRGSGVSQSLGDELQTDEYAAKHAMQFMLNRARPDFIVMPKSDTEEIGEENVKRLRASWMQRHRGFMKAFLPYFSSRAIDVKEITQSFESLQFVELRKFERDVVQQVWGVPPEVLGIVANSNRATIEGAQFIFASYVLVPRLEFLRETYQERLVPEYDERILIDYASPVEEDRQFELAAAKASPHALRVDEWRTKFLGLPPLEDGAGGNRFVASFGVQSVESIDELGLPSLGEGAGTTADDEATDPAKAMLRALPAINRDVHDDGLTFIHRIADRLTPRMRIAFRSAIATVKDKIILEKLETALTSGAGEAAFNQVPWADLEKALNGTYRIVRVAIEQAGNAAALELASNLQMDLTFDLAHPRAERWAAERSATRIAEVTEGSKAAVREIIAQAFRDGMPPAEAARLIRDVVGLRVEQAERVAAFRAGLTEQGVDPDKVISRTERFAQAQLNKRAITIARTETIAAANQGQRELWKQAAEQGYIKADLTRRKFLTALDDVVDPICEGMHGQVVGLDEPFVTPDGEEVDSAPVHPNCRCSERLVFLAADEVAEAA